MEQQGWIKIHRKILENPISKKPTYAWLWVYLLLKANHEESRFLWNGKDTIIKNGQLITGSKTLSQETNIPESTIEDILKFLENQQQIRQQKTTKFRIITILKWDMYQQKNNKSNNKATTKQQQADTNKNDKNDKNDKNKILATQESCEVNKFISLFKDINPSYERLFPNKNQRQAIERMVKKWGEQKVENSIKALKDIINKPFAPKITTPIELERDLGKLIAFINQSKGKERSSGSPIIR